MDASPTAGCPIERALRVLDGKWSVLIIRDLLGGPKRFTELRTSLGMGSPKTLTERGHSFRAVLEAMAAWGDRDLYELAA